MLVQQQLLFVYIKNRSAEGDAFVMPSIGPPSC